MMKVMDETQHTYCNVSETEQTVFGYGVVAPNESIVVIGELNNANFEEVVAKPTSKRNERTTS